MTQKDLFEEDPLSLQVDIHANHLVSQVVGEAKKTLATSIRTSKELLNKSDPLGQFTKMFMDTSLSNGKHWLRNEDVCVSV